MFARGSPTQGFSQTLPSCPGHYRQALTSPIAKSDTVSRRDKFSFFCLRGGAGDIQRPPSRPNSKRSQTAACTPTGYRGSSVSPSTTSSRTHEIFAKSMSLARWLSPTTPDNAGPNSRRFGSRGGVWPPISRNDAVLAPSRTLLPMTIGDARRKRACTLEQLPEVSVSNSAMQNMRGHTRRLPKGVKDKDVYDAVQGMVLRGGQGYHNSQSLPGQLSLFPGTVIAHFGPGT